MRLPGLTRGNWGRHHHHYLLSSTSVVGAEFAILRGGANHKRYSVRTEVSSTEVGRCEIVAFAVNTFSGCTHRPSRHESCAASPWPNHVCGGVVKRWIGDWDLRKSLLVAWKVPAGSLSRLILWEQSAWPVIGCVSCFLCMIICLLVVGVGACLGWA